ARRPAVRRAAAGHPESGSARLPAPARLHRGPRLAVELMATVDDRLRANDVRRRLTAIFVGSVGTLVEWYDFYAYAAFSLYFAASFFPGSDPVVQQLNAAVLFALGFIVRPIGGWLFGHLADHYG